MVEEKELNKYKVAELKQLLQQQGVTPKGLKADLVRQLYEVLKSREDAEAAQVAYQEQQQYQHHLAGPPQMQNQIVVSPGHFMPQAQVYPDPAVAQQEYYQQQLLQQQLLQQQQIQQQQELERQQQIIRQEQLLQQQLQQQQQYQQEQLQQQQLLQQQQAQIPYHHQVQESVISNEEDYSQPSVDLSDNSAAQYQHYQQPVPEDIMPEEVSNQVAYEAELSNQEGSYEQEEYNQDSQDSYPPGEPPQEDQFLDDNTNNTSQDVPSIASDSIYVQPPMGEESSSNEVPQSYQEEESYDEDNFSRSVPTLEQESQSLTSQDAEIETNDSLPEESSSSNQFSNDQLVPQISEVETSPVNDVLNLKSQEQIITENYNSEIENQEQMALPQEQKTLPQPQSPIILEEEEEEEEQDEPQTFPVLSTEELAKMTKSQRNRYKRKMRKRIQRRERDQIEVKKQELMASIENKIKSEPKNKTVEIKQEIEQDDDDRMDIDDEDEAEEEKEKKKMLEEEAKTKIEQNGNIELDEKIEIEYIPEEFPKDAVYMQFLKVFDKFSAVSPDEANRLEAERLLEFNRNRDDRTKMLELKKPVEMEFKDDDEKVLDADGEKMSKRKLKQLTRMGVADLKQNVTHPELVEMHDITARDPVLLLQLKSTRNTVPVPRHWCYKRKYLQGKRGFEKPPFKLPEFIRRTGIQEMREALQEKEDSKSLKNKMREKIRPKMGKIDIDYQKLHDAFFKWQTKPKMTIHGDLYYEGKEFETRLKDKKPGDLTNDLRSALGMPTGPNAAKCPPPWLIAMQRYGPPPSYPNLKIAGLNAPIPEGCSFGYHAGGWGKPPVDEYGRPLYGDVFGITASAGDITMVEEEVDRTKWGELESDEESEAEESEDEDEDGDEEGRDQSGLVTPAAEGLVTPSGISSVPAGIETPDMIELRKRKQAIEAEMESGENPALFTVVPEKKTDRYGKEMMGSMHVYDFASLSKTSSKSSHREGIDVALDPSELEAGALDSNQMAAKYEQTIREQSGGNPHEDLSDMVAEYAASKQKRRKGEQDSSKSSGSRDKSKKYQFKF